MMKRVLLGLLLAAAPVHAQSAGQTGAQVLQFNGGARAAALSGAFTAALSDAEALFYNPAGTAGARRGASAAYETYSTDVSFGSLAGFTQLDRFSIGASLVYLDAGKIDEVIPDPNFGGNIGIETGNTTSATQTAAKLSLAGTVGSTMRLGASIGFISNAIADLNETAPIADVGAQYDVASITVAAAIRNLGGKLGNDPLPTEARVGVMRPFGRPRGFAANVFADAIMRMRESSFAVSAGVEAGVLPSATNAVGAVVRLGLDTESNQLSPLHFGAGLTVHAVSFDYAYQRLDLVGAVHRVGVRWIVR